MKHVIDIAKKKAEKSLSKYKISAVGLNKHGKVVATAINRPRFSRYGGGVHAEMAVLHKAGPKIKTIIICRVGANGAILPINPCSRCKRVLNKLGIKVYTVTE